MRGIAACMIVCALGIQGAGAPSAWAEIPNASRAVVSLDGQWDIEDSVAADGVPKAFRHTVPVPGLAHSSTPAFTDVDDFLSKQVLSSLVYYDKYSQADYDRLGDIRGISHQRRNYFWYRKRFVAPSRRDVAILEVDKAQFGTVVYLNGIRIGEHNSCFTAGYFDVSRAIHWNKPNVVVIRIGAHPGVLPPTVTGGTDFEKLRWTPGIYDSVSLLAADNPIISSVQVAPRLAAIARFSAERPCSNGTAELHGACDRHSVTPADCRVEVGPPRNQPCKRSLVHLAPGETKLVKQSLALPGAQLWSPEHPFLYVVDTGDTRR